MGTGEEEPRWLSFLPRRLVEEAWTKWGAAAWDQESALVFFVFRFLFFALLVFFSLDMIDVGMFLGHGEVVQGEGNKRTEWGDRWDEDLEVIGSGEEGPQALELQGSPALL